MSGAEVGGQQPENFIKPDLLIQSVGQSAIWYTRVSRQLNERRSSDDQFEVVPAAELPGLAGDWLTTERTDAINESLGYTLQKLPVVMPVPNVPVSRREILMAWRKTRRAGLLVPSYRVLDYLEEGGWTDNQLSGYDPKHSDQAVRFVAIEQHSPQNRLGNMAAQRKQLKVAQATHPSVRPAAIFEGAVLANRDIRKTKTKLQDSAVRAINLKRTSYRNSVPAANLCDDGAVSYVGFAPESETQVARRVVA